MKKTSKALLLCTLLGTCVGATALYCGNLNALIIKAANKDAVWGHYTAVAAGDNTPGCKEFWISCDTHQVVFEQPTSYISIENRGAPTTADILSWKNDGTGRYLPFVGDTVKLGAYPQTMVIDYSLNIALNDEAGDSPTNSDFKSWTAYNYQNTGYGATDGYVWYKDITYQNQKYRGVHLGTALRSKICTLNSNTAENSTVDEWGYSLDHTYWFKFEDLQWKVLKNDSGKYMLWSYCIVDAIQFFHSRNQRTINSTTIYANNYKHSDIRTFINNDFYNLAFNDTEKTKISVTEVDNSKETTQFTDNTTYVSENTNDKMFLLSFAEAYNESFGFVSNNSRIIGSTDYSHIQGVNRNSTGIAQAYSLRSFFGNETSAAAVGNSNGSGKNGVAVVNISGVAPAMNYVF